MVAWSSVVMTNMRSSQTRVNTNLQNIQYTTQTVHQSYSIPRRRSTRDVDVTNLQSVKSPWVWGEIFWKYLSNRKSCKVSAKNEYIAVKSTRLTSASYTSCIKNPKSHSIYINVTYFALQYAYGMCFLRNLGGAEAQRLEHWTCELWSIDRGFKSYSGQSWVTTSGKLFKTMCLCHQAV